MLPLLGQGRLGEIYNKSECSICHVQVEVGVTFIVRKKNCSCKKELSWRYKMYMSTFIYIKLIIQSNVCYLAKEML